MVKRIARVLADHCRLRRGKRDKDRRCKCRGMADSMGDLKAIHPGHVDVDEGNIRLEARHESQRLRTVSRGLRRVPQALQQAQQGVRGTHIIIDDKNPQCGRHGAFFWE